MLVSEPSMEPKHHMGNKQPDQRRTNEFATRIAAALHDLLNKTSERCKFHIFMLIVALALATAVRAYVIVSQDHDGSRFRTIEKRTPLHLEEEPVQYSMWKLVDHTRKKSANNGTISTLPPSSASRIDPSSSNTRKIELQINAMPVDPTIHPQIQQQQELNRISKRFDAQRPAGAIERHHEDLVARGLSSGLKKRASRATIIRSAPARDAGELSIDQDGKDVSYFSTVYIGSHAKAFIMVMDTGSSDLWVPAADCQDKACLNHATFGPEDSETFRTSSADWKITYGSGGAAGSLVQDTLQIANLSLGPVTFGTASRLTNSFANFPADGIMGLGSSKASTQKIPTIMDNLMTAGLLQRKLIGVNLNRASDGSRDGMITFGSIDLSRFAGQLVQVPNVAKNGLWEAKIDSVGVEDEKIAMPTTTTGIIDTGTTLLIAPSAIATAIHAAIPNAQTDTQGTFAIPCSTNERISLTFGGVPFYIPPKDYVGHPLDGVNSAIPLCLSKISGQTIKGPNTLLVGDVFLKNVYSVYDFDNNQIGFGRK